MIKGAWDPCIQQKRYAKFYFGLNVIGEEAVTPIGMHSIKIPFMKGDRAFIRFKKVIPQQSYAGHKIRCDQELKRLKKIKLSLEGKPDTALAMLTDTYVRMLEYISEGPYDSNRG